MGLLFANNLAFGIDAEFKNSLVKVELKKALNAQFMFVLPSMNYICSTIINLTI